MLKCPGCNGAERAGSSGKCSVCNGTGVLCPSCLNIRPRS